MDIISLIPLGIILSLYLGGGHFLALVLFGSLKPRWLLKHKILTIIVFEFHAIFWMPLSMIYLSIGIIYLIPQVIIIIFREWNQFLQEQTQKGSDQ